MADKKFKRIDAQYIVKGDNVSIFKEYNIPRVTKIGDKQERQKFYTKEEKIDYLLKNMGVNIVNELFEVFKDGNIVKYETVNLTDEEKTVYERAENLYEYQQYISRKKSTRRSKMAVIDYALCNPQLATFITLTWEDNMQDYLKALNEFQNFRRRVGRELRKIDKKFEYIATFERQKRGAWHIHLLTNIELQDWTYLNCINWVVKKGSKIYKTRLRKIIERQFAKKFWCNGFIDYRKLYDSSGSAKYISKYMCKDTVDIMNKEGITRRYLCSKGLNKPKTIDYDFSKKNDVVNYNNVYGALLNNADSINICVYDYYTTEKEKQQGIEKKIIYSEFTRKSCDIGTNGST